MGDGREKFRVRGIEGWARVGTRVVGAREGGGGHPVLLAWLRARAGAVGRGRERESARHSRGERSAAVRAELPAGECSRGWSVP